MRRVLPLFLLLCLPAPAAAKWGYVTLETLVQQSDLIVVGTLRGVSEHTDGETDYGQGHVVVREVIWGRVAPGDGLLLKWSNPSGLACPRVEHRHSEGEEGIWLLTAEGGHVEANYPGRFVKLGERAAVESALARFPVSLRGGKYFVTPGEPLTFTVVYRNSSDKPRSFPGVDFAGGLLRLGPGSRLNVKVELKGQERRLQLAGGMTWDRGLAPVTVAARGEHRVEVNLRDLLTTGPVDGEFYDAQLFLRGLRPTNEVSFYLGKPLFPEPREATAASAGTPATVGVFHAPRRPRGLPPHRRAMLTFVAAFSLYLLLNKYRAR
jgi:hypothetical protein